MDLGRRRFLAGLAAGLPALALGAAGPACRRGAPDGALAGAIRSQFAELAPDDAVIERFLRDHEQLSPQALRYDVPDRVDPLGTFLLSTDFFQGGGRGGRPLAYVRYYDPYLSPCRNPLARRAAGPQASGGWGGPGSSPTGTRA